MRPLAVGRRTRCGELARAALRRIQRWAAAVMMENSVRPISGEFTRCGT